MRTRQTTSTLAQATTALRVQASWLMAVLLVTAAALSLYLVQSSTVATSGYRLQRLEAERREWEVRNQQLVLELAKRRSEAWAESQALQRGMVRAGAPAYVRVQPTDLRPPEVMTSADHEDRIAARPEPASPGILIDLARGWLTALLNRGA